VRADSIPYAFPPPYDTGNIWTDLEGGGNAWWSGPTADANTGEMGYEMKPGIGQSGSMACWVAVGLMLSVPRTPYTRIDFSVTTSLDWSYTEFSTTWRETKGNLWIGQYADLYDENGSFVENALATQNVIASWDDRNLFGNGGNKGSQNPVTIPLLQVSVPVAGSWDGGTIDYRCWLGGSGLADGSQQQSGCQAQMDAVCSQLVADIFF